MKDMLVRLLDLPDFSVLEKTLKKEDAILFRRPIAPEKSIVIDWVKSNFSSNWANEISVSFTTSPANCFIAQRDQDILGFSCFEATGKNFFGPTAVLESERGRGIGKILLVKSLKGLKNLGYTYGIIGGVGPIAYYEKTVNAVVIENSEKSIYQNMLKAKE